MTEENLTPDQAEQAQEAEEQSASQMNGPVVSAARDVTFSDGLAFTVVAGRDVEFSDGASGVMVAGGNVEMTDGASGVMVVGGSAAVTDGMVLSAFSGQASLENSFCGVLISGNTQLNEGSRVLLNTPQALALGAAFGAVFGLLSWLLRRK